jgi:hypothetical protein
MTLAERLEELKRDPQRDENRLQVLIYIVGQLAEDVEELRRKLEANK